jgi:hypothetical protein
MPNKNAVKGHNWERKIINWIKPFWKWAKSSRATSRQLDNCKVDINFIPLLIQAKATLIRPNFQKLWEECMRLIDIEYPPKEAKELKKKPYVVFHKDTSRKAGPKAPHTETMTVTAKFGRELLELWAENNKDED